MTNGNDPINMGTTEFGTMGGQYGLTKREYFAAMALQGLCVQAIAGSHNLNTLDLNLEKAKHAANLADVLIYALNEHLKP
jgi:hypothetical protein